MPESKLGGSPHWVQSLGACGLFHAGELLDLDRLSLGCNDRESPRDGSSGPGQPLGSIAPASLGAVRSIHMVNLRVPASRAAVTSRS
jgi:hypothetical protein